MTNKNPNAMMSNAPRKFMCNDGTSMMAVTSPTMPMATNFNERSRSVRGVSVPVEPLRVRLKSRRPPWMPCQMVGSAWIRLMTPPAATAPAPM